MTCPLHPAPRQPGAQLGPRMGASEQGDGRTQGEDPPEKWAVHSRRFRFSLLSRAYCPAKGGRGRNSGPPSGPQPHLGRCISSFSPLPTPASSPPVQGVTVAQRSSSPTPGAAPSEGKGHFT